MDSTRTQREILVDGLFDLLYRRMWISRYDPRNGGLYTVYRQRMLALVREMNRAEGLDSEASMRIEELVQLAAADVRALAAAKVIPVTEVAEAESVLSQIVEVFGNNTPVKG